MSDMITYVHERSRHSGYGYARVEVPRESLVYKKEVDGWIDDAAVVSLFVDALKRMGCPVDRLVREAKLRHAPSPEPWVHFQSWKPTPEPWPIFVCIGDGCYGEFYPIGFEG